MNSSYHAVASSESGVGEGCCLRLSVAMCTHNGERFLRQQIDSILQQVPKIDEIVIADDASVDGTKQILLDYQRKIPNIFELYFHPVALGAIANFEFAISKCSGDLIFLGDQDDVWKPEKVKRMLIPFERQRCLLVFSDGDLIDEVGTALGTTLWKKWEFTVWRRFCWKWITGAALFDLSHNDNKVTGATLAMRRSLLDGSMPILVPNGYWHDAWFALHAAARGGLVFLPECLINYRIHPKQQVGISRDVKRKTPSSITSASFFENLKQQYPRRANLIANEKWVVRLARTLSPR